MDWRRDLRTPRYVSSSFTAESDILLTHHHLRTRVPTPLNWSQVKSATMLVRKHDNSDSEKIRALRAIDSSHHMSSQNTHWLLQAVQDHAVSRVCVHTRSLCISWLVLI